MTTLGIVSVGKGLLVEMMTEKISNPNFEHLTESGRYIAEEPMDR